ncbi:MAG TPA: NAD-dependent epimerase/dehydratase family protein [Planctomycetota bacterium]|nr:NAD-dependent epimerase/dehydratase family protein [Planctomycetota bacterium]
MSRYLVTGGAGFLGINLVRHLLAKGHDVTSLDIAEFDYEDCKEKVRIVTGDIRDVAAVTEATEGADVVVHCAAALPLYKKDVILSTDVDGTRNVMEAAHRAGIRRVVHVSSTAVYGIPDHHPLYEDDRLEGVGPYGEAKILAEEVCLEYRKKGMCIPIVRPKSFIGPERLGVFVLLYDWAHTGHNFPMIGRGNNRYQLLDVEDLCEAIALTATMDVSVVNDTFNIGAKAFTTMKEDFQVVLDEAGFGRRIVTFPAWPMIWTLRVLEVLHLSPLYKWVYETACEESFVSIEKAERVLHFTPRYSNKDALLRNYHWYLDNLDRFRGKTGISHRVPWKQGILAVAKWFI